MPVVVTSMTELEKLLEKTRYILASNPQICVFSLSGFTEEVIKNFGNCRLISLDDMYYEETPFKKNIAQSSFIKGLYSSENSMLTR